MYFKDTMFMSKTMILTHYWYIFLHIKGKIVKSLVLAKKLKCEAVRAEAMMWLYELIQMFRLTEASYLHVCKCWCPSLNSPEFAWDPSNLCGHCLNRKMLVVFIFSEDFFTCAQIINMKTSSTWSECLE